MATPGAKDFIISGAPQCPLPEANMGTMIANAVFDVLFIQHYSNDAYGCSAVNFSSTVGGGNFNFGPGTAGAQQYGDWYVLSYARMSQDYHVALSACLGASALEPAHSCPFHS